ncbi:hypothetical protein DITRI_Ditri17bG0048300 [Diplodiscus trichospermus]
MSFSEALFPLFFLLFFIPIFYARNLQQYCSSSSSCGDIKNISYPFRLQGDPVGCGDPSFQLSCQDNTTILNFRGGKYYVKGISYDQRTIRIVDVNLANGSCALPYKSLSMDEATDDSRFPSLINFWQANFVNCSNSIPDLANRKAHCLSGNNYYVYLNFSNRNLFAYEIPKTCKVISRIPMSSENEVNYPYETTLKLLSSGFDLRWSVECKDCRAADLPCVYKSNSDPRIFQCENVEYGSYYYVSNFWKHYQFIYLLIPNIAFIFLVHC